MSASEKIDALDRAIPITEDNHPATLDSFAEVDPEIRAMALQMTADFIGDAMDWIYQGGIAKKCGVILRTYALLYMVNPVPFGNQTEFAKSLGVSKKVLNTSLSSFRDQFGYRLPRMRTNETRTRYSKLKAEYHANKKTSEPVQSDAA
jgi:hypothetical protein